MHLLADAQVWDPFPPTGHFDDTSDRRDANHAVAVSAVGLALTGLIELAIAVVSGSVGLLGDALHNLSDVSTSLVVFIGFRVSKRPAMPSHPYGYERAEDLAGLGVALVIWASAVFAGAVSIHKLTVHGRTSHLGLGMAAALVGIVGNQVVARYKRRVGHRIQSATVIADARHSWLDALSSAGALLGLVGVAVGLRWADAVAGLIVTGFIVHVGWEVTSELFVHLMDGVDPAVMAAAEAAALTVPGVEHVHVRGRWVGRSLLLEVEGFVPAHTTVEAAEILGRHVERAVMAGVPESRAFLWSPRSCSLPRASLLA
jgi:cation diffusion facilitator family transporter